MHAEIPQVGHALKRLAYDLERELVPAALVGPGKVQAGPNGETSYVTGTPGVANDGSALGDKSCHLGRISA